MPGSPEEDRQDGGIPDRDGSDNRELEMTKKPGKKAEALHRAPPPPNNRIQTTHRKQRKQAKKADILWIKWLLPQVLPVKAPESCPHKNRVAKRAKRVSFRVICYVSNRPAVLGGHVVQLS